MIMIFFMVMPVMGERLVDVYKPGDTLSLKHQKQLWNIYLTLDKIGVLHNDGNCLNIMLDLKGNVKLIDFDRSKIIDSEIIKKWGNYPNLRFLKLDNCWVGSLARYQIRPGKHLISWYRKLFGTISQKVSKHKIFGPIPIEAVKKAIKK